MNSSGLLSAAGDPRPPARPLGAEVPRLSARLRRPGNARPGAPHGRNRSKYARPCPDRARDRPLGDPTPLHPPRDPGSPRGQE